VGYRNISILIWKRIFACCGFTREAKNVWVKKKIFFLFLGILMDERFIFVSSALEEPRLILMMVHRETYKFLTYRHHILDHTVHKYKNCDFLFFFIFFCISLKRDEGIGHV
jgi:hypothetical protein